MGGGHSIDGDTLSNLVAVLTMQVKLLKCNNFSLFLNSEIIHVNCCKLTIPLLPQR